jgi:hypothetical protein
MRVREGQRERNRDIQEESQSSLVISIKDPPRICQRSVPLLPILEEEDGPEGHEEHEEGVPWIVHSTSDELMSKEESPKDGGDLEEVTIKCHPTKVKSNLRAEIIIETIKVEPSS